MYKGPLSPCQNSLGFLLASPEEKVLVPQLHGLGFPSKMLSVAFALSLLTCLICQCSGCKGTAWALECLKLSALQPFLWAPPSAHLRRNDAA